MNLFYQFLLEHGPNVVSRDLVFLDFMHKTIAEGAVLFLKNLLNEQDIQKSISGEFKAKFEKENKELKEELTKEKTNLSNRLSSVEKQKVELEIKEEELKKNLKDLKENKEKNEGDLKFKHNEELRKLNQLLNESKGKLALIEEELNISKKNSMVRDSDLEKKNALLSQKVEYLQKSLSESTNREKDWEVKFLSLKSDNSSQIKEISAKYEGQNKNLTFTINELTEKLLDYESKVSSESQNWVKEKENYVKKELNFKSSIQEANQTIDTLMKQINEFNTVEREKNLKIKREYEETIETLTRKLDGFESNLKEKDDNVINFHFIKDFLKDFMLFSLKPTVQPLKKTKRFCSKSWNS